MVGCVTFMGFFVLNSWCYQCGINFAVRHFFFFFLLSGQNNDTTNTTEKVISIFFSAKYLSMRDYLFYLRD